MFSELTAVPAALRLPVGFVAAIPAVVVMDRVMSRLRDGTTPPSVAASVLTETPIDRSPDRLASVVHYLAALGTGVLFIYGSLLVEWVLGGASVGSLAATTFGLYVLMVGFFVVVPLPRATGLGRTRRRVVARSWAVAAATYLLVLVPISTALSLGLA
ncbi:hypothetical protein [Natrarchaeobaculum sulfurireducens]|uniref:Uncharacterized protein n=1 Tax=Natrarchaeobaculum sulfurireducens TaxID=2044521 RepID=A0A346PBH2_9EURY|nr:hypothetical protein [Natrarchaeobaculum sulfurireducens]AXR76867.1 hypothetical protein AArc1_0523 [Natrarchaeobaculum sulfurireducens]AXR80533.1 hypothetical protein AArcMg_0510 [Natrarchaeobaculum sulfurireducens]